MAFGIREQWENLRRLTAAQITTGANNFVAIGTPIDNPCRQYIVTNSTDVSIVFSTDGVNEKFELLPGVQFVSDVSTNTVADYPMMRKKNDTLYAAYVGAANPTSGGVSYAVMYAKGD